MQGYENATAYLRHTLTSEEPWPRHFSESGASLALTCAMFRRLAEVPTPPLGEDRALLDCVRAAGGRVRHPTDVHVCTSARMVGRASGGCSDTLSRWCEQPDAQPVGGASSVARIILSAEEAAEALSFEALPLEVRRARALVRSLRHQAGALLALPEIEPEFLVSQGETG